jgi:hypothetical protein
MQNAAPYGETGDLLSDFGSGAWKRCGPWCIERPYRQLIPVENPILPGGHMRRSVQHGETVTGSALIYVRSQCAVESTQRGIIKIAE